MALVTSQSYKKRKENFLEKPEQAVSPFRRSKNSFINMASKKRNENDVPPDEMGQLLAETNFTKGEIADFYRYASPGVDSISKKEFGQLCFENGVKNPALVNRIWSLWDIDGDGSLSHFEVVKGLTPILRGNRVEVAFFCTIYMISTGIPILLHQKSSQCTAICFISLKETTAEV
jgi:hypothetical protein